jgi:hypothetical protein
LGVGGRAAVAKCKEVKTGCNMAEPSERSYGLRRAVLPVMMILMMMIGWMSGEIGELDYRYGTICSLLHGVQTGAWPHPAFQPKGKGKVDPVLN